MRNTRQFFSEKFEKKLREFVAQKEFANQEKYPEAYTESGDIVAILNRIEMHKSTSVIIVTHGHIFDLEALEVVINMPLRYVGMIGSKSKIIKCFESLKKRGITKSQLENIYAPIGLDIGGETPEEIALAILSEIQSVKYKRTNQHLSDKNKLVDSLS